MRHLHLLIISTIALFVSCSTPCAESPSVSDNLVLWYDHPAQAWEECLPLGNGRLGAMLAGGVAQEYIGLNEESMWSGGVQHTDNPEALEWLPRIREALLEGNNRRAEMLMYRYFTCSGGGSASPEYGCYQMFCNLLVTTDIANGATVEDYRRELCLRDAIARTSFTVDGVEHRREYFTSYEDNALMMRYSASAPTNYTLTLRRTADAEIIAGDGGITIRGVLPSGSDNEGVNYIGRLNVVATNGTSTGNGDVLTIEGATDITLCFVAATNYNETWSLRDVDTAIFHTSYDYYAQRQRHIAAYRELFDRVEIDLGEQRLDIPTDRRLEEYAVTGDDPSLAALYAQYGRYLLLSSAYKAKLPPNLQGIWAAGTWTPWNGDMHLNINQQMNHWPLEVGNLGELIDPLTRYVEGLAESGEHTAKHFYDAEGWCAHILANAWASPRHLKTHRGALQIPVARG